ncbi:DNA polymerase III catalytic subunit, DnaE type [Granulicatella balaenopterae]|uniref:DNA polymerase III subunit alpha n=1 Tax=Granulicatella balaenopterae TaxID=137733 RepID=A0A1H9HVA1_9LACT|nr:DNA polymerase III subunit alpha [Granulicatella balaenopterae]SEQ66152.1 DNA polymerase III catalytic subunit, DnaE type [Granulicatella balaenopterae]
MNFVTLQVASAYSLLKSTIAIDEYVKLGKKLGYDALALSDQGMMHGALEFYQTCQRHQIRPIIGCEFAIPGVLHQEFLQPIMVYAKNKAGYHSLIKLSTIYQEKGCHAEFIEEINQQNSNLKVLLAYKDSEWLRYIDQPELLVQYFATIREMFPTIELALGIGIQQVDSKAYQVVAPIAKQLAITPIAHQVTFYLYTEDDFSWRVLEAIDQGQQLQNYASEITGPYYLHETHAMKRMFVERKAKELITNHLAFIEDLAVEIDMDKHLLPKYQVPNDAPSNSYLKEVCQKGLLQRGVANNSVYQERLNYELTVIEDMGFSDYFLIVWDIMAYAHKADIQTGPGRGSAAGSLVAYALDITQVDPIEHGLIFERFLNRERFTMPDIDLDFPDNKRELVLQYVLEKYGKAHVAQIATFGTLAAKQALRDVGRVMGLSVTEMAQWSKAVPNQLKIKLTTAYQQSRALREIVERSPRNQLIYQTALKIEGLPRHMSTHAAGVVISDRPLVDHIPLVYREGELPITQYTMNDVEKIGLLKMDFLGLKNLTILYDALQFVKKINHEAIDIYQINPQDEKTLKLFGEAYTNGIFQFESDGIKQVLRRLKPSSLEDIAAVNALYRPGPMEQIDTFIKRKNHKETIRYINSDLAPILESTYGIMVYQEQVLQVACKFAGFSLGEADILRRAIGKKKLAVIEQEKVHFIEGAKNLGYEEQTAIEVYRYIERFANYGFNKSHAYAYSLLAYQLAYLKANYPSAFFAALLKSMNASSKKAQDYLTEAKRAGVRVLPPSIQTSVMDFTVSDTGIITGLGAIKGLRKDVMMYIIQNRANYGEYRGFMDFCFRLGKKYCREEVISALVYVGALDSFGETRASLIATIPGVVESVNLHGDNLVLDVNDELFPKMEVKPEISLLEKLDKEIEFLGYPISAHPTEEYQEAYDAGIVQTINDIFEAKIVSVLGVITSVKRIRTKKGEPMAFATLQDATGTIDLVLFQRDYPKYYQLLEEKALVQITGKVSKNRMNDWQIQIQKVHPIEIIAEMLKESKKKCYLKIDENHYNQQTMDKISRIVQQHSGFTPVFIYLNREKKVVKPNFIRGIKISNNSTYELEKIVGQENVRIVE